MYVEPMVGCPTITHTLDAVSVNQIPHSGNPHFLEIWERTMVMIELYRFRKPCAKGYGTDSVGGYLVLDKRAGAKLHHLTGMLGKRGSAQSS